MLQRKPIRKLLYPAGLLSLSFLPFICFGIFYQQYLQKESQRSLEVTYWDPADSLAVWTPSWWRNPLKRVNEKFIKIKLTGANDDKIKLDYAKVALREMMQKNDSTLGIEFTFANNSKYSSLVGLYDLCEVEGVRHYLSYQDKFLIFNSLPISMAQPETLICGTRYASCMSYTLIPGNKTNLHSLISDVSGQPILANLSILLFIALVCLSGRKILFLCR